MPNALTLRPAFRPRFVAFLDVLGFKDLVYRADKELDARQTIRRAISILRNANNDRRNSGYQFTHFSDSIVLSADLTAIGARAIFESCTRLSTALLDRGHLLRGGLTVGNVIHQDGLLYGSGMIEAYLLDQQAQPPRISVTATATDVLRSKCTAAFIGRYVVKDQYDLLPMVHTLQEFARFGSKTARIEQTRIVLANRMAGRIALQSKNLSLLPDVRAKWRWLRVYWNRSMRKYGVVDRAT